LVGIKRKDINIRKLARGESCALEGWFKPCSDPETVVWAHLATGGMGMKCPDIIGAPLCHFHHDYIDGRIKWNGQTGQHDWDAKFHALKRGVLLVEKARGR